MSSRFKCLATQRSLPPLRVLAVPFSAVLVSSLAFSSQYLFYSLSTTFSESAPNISFSQYSPPPQHGRKEWTTRGPVPGVVRGGGQRGGVGPLTTREAWVFNLVVAAVAICYVRTSFTDPGRVPKLDKEKVEAMGLGKMKWCRKCENIKPPRAHHCKSCKRYVDPLGTQDFAVMPQLLQ
jgi:ribosomal protein L40E